MHKAMAVGFFVISLFVGVAFVMFGVPNQSDLIVGMGMVIIGAGIINLAVHIIPSAPVPIIRQMPVRAKPVRKRIAKVRKKAKKKRKSK